jgi:PAS domain S-box-containing protein
MILFNKPSTFNYKKMKISLLRFVILSLLLLFFEVSYAQKYVIKTYTIEDGLPTRNINDACQDSNGIMWFATSQGISRYDGFSFTNFDNSDGLPDQLYRKIRIDERGIIWALPDIKYDTIIFLEKNIWKKIPPPPGENLIPKMNTFDVIYKNDKPVICMGSYDGYYIFENGSWNHLVISTDIESNYVYSVIAHNQKFYLSTEIGLCIIENGKPDWSLNKLIEPYGKDIIAINFENKDTPSEKLWVLTEKWLGYIQHNSFTMVTDKFQLPHPTIFYYSFVNSDKKGNVIFGNIWAKYFISKSSNKPAPLLVANGFLSDGATSVFIDREQNIWITDTRGINKINNLKVTNYFDKNGMLEDEVTAIAEMNDGKIVLGHNIGLSILNNNSFKTIPFPPSLENTRRVQDMIKDNKGNIWFVSISLGLGRLQPEGNIIWYYSEKYPTITAVHQDENGRIWVGADRKLLYIEDDKLVEHKQFGEDRNTLRRIFSYYNGGILIAGLEGLWHLDKNIIEKIPSPPGRIAESVFSYFKGKDGVEYVGTKNGLYVIVKGKIEKFKKNGIEINSPVFFILQDREENYWFGSNQGVYKWDGENTLETYNIYNGLAGWETNRAAGMLDSKGRVWVGTDRGLSCFEPDYDKVVVPAPVIQLQTAEDSKGLLHDLAMNSTVSFSDNTLVFHFRGISFVNEDLIEYKYKLEGFDRDWQDANQSMLDKIKYIGLRPGKYTFCVKARNFAGKWSEVARSETIRITAPFYIRWWFIALSILLFGIFVFALFRIYVQKVHNASLQKEILERKRIELALIESRRRYQDLVELLPETIYESDCNGKLTYLNDTGFRLFGYSQSDLENNLNLKQVIASFNQIEIDEHLTTIHVLKYPARSVLTGRKKDGTSFPVSIHTVPILHNQKCLGARGIIIDLTEQKRTEELLQKNADDLKALNNSKDKFFSIIAHDLRSPFTSFLGLTEILDEEFDSLPKEELSSIISSLRASASNLYQLLENLLQWSLLQREIIRFEPKTRFLLPLVTNCIEVITIPAKQKEIEISIEIPGNLEITADVNMLQTIIRNLVSNAIKFTNRGGDIRVSGTFTEEQIYLITVKDTGIGISAERQKEIFRLDANNKTKGTEGELSTGLGLILCKEFVEKHGGKIWVESSEGKGSTFYFTLKKL